MHGAGWGMARRAFQNVTRALPKPRYRGRSGSASRSEPERIIPVDLKSRRSRVSRIRAERKRRVHQLEVVLVLIGMAAVAIGLLATA